MKRATLAAALLSLLGCTAPTRTGPAIVDRLPGCDWEPFSNADETQWGYLDGNGKVVVTPQFRHAEGFLALGLASVLLPDGQWGYINCAGQTFSVMTFDIAPDRFHEGLARKQRGDKVGFVNLHGEFVIPPRFGAADSFCQGLAQVGDDCVSEQHGEHRITKCSKNAWIDRSGNAVPTPKSPPDCPPAS